MPSAPRTVSESGLYHVVARGNGKQLIFNNDADRSAFLTYLERFAQADDVQVIAWCLMDNHVHLVVEDQSQRLSLAVGSLLGAYAKYFNQKTGHVGSVFQQRFFSEAINTDDYLLATVRYVHVNPAKAGMCPASEYHWSSYREYTEGSGDGISSTALVLDMLQGPKGFVELCRGGQPGDIGFEGVIKLSSEEALEMAGRIVESFGCPDVSAVKTLPHAQRNEIITALRGNGLTIKQVERLTGIGGGIIARARAK